MKAVAPELAVFKARLALAALWLAAATALAQSSEPATLAAPTADDVARTFVSACVLNEGRGAAVTDWALVQGFQTVDPLHEHAALPLLDGAPGHVLVMPGSGGAVLLAVAQGDRCVVWAERQPGPALRLALLRELAALAGQGARLQTEVDRNLERAGGWRNLLQWRYRRVGGTQELSLGAVTTLGDAPAAQALNLAPARPAPSRDPDGAPLR